MSNDQTDILLKVIIILIQSNKGKKYCFEIRMQDQNCHLFAGETETDANDWILTINMALQNTIEAQKEKYGQYVAK